MFIQEYHLRRGTLRITYACQNRNPSLYENGKELFERTFDWFRPCSASHGKKFPPGSSASQEGRVQIRMWDRWVVQQWSAWLVPRYNNGSLSTDSWIVWATGLDFKDETTDDEGHPEYFSRNMGWNWMSDGAFVSDSTVGMANNYNFNRIQQVGGKYTSDAMSVGKVDFMGSEYDLHVLEVADDYEYDVDKSCPSSEYYRYITSCEDRSLEAWDADIYDWYDAGRSCSAQRNTLGSPGSGFYTRGLEDVSVGMTFAGPFPSSLVPFRYAMVPVGEAPVMTPDSLEMGRITEDGAVVSFGIATSAHISMTIDGVLTVEIDVEKGDASIDLSAFWDALAPGWHEILITAVNESGYKCSAKRTFIKAFSGLLTGHERDGMEPKYLLYSRWGRQLEEMQPYDVTHRQEINGEDSLGFSLDEVLAKGDRILWNDGHGWREHAVVGIDQSHDASESASYHCETTMMGDLDAKQLETFSASGTCAQSLSSLLQGTLWSVGTVDVEGVKSATWEKKSAYEVLMEMAGLYGAEVYPSLECDVGGIVNRKVNMVAKMGADRGARFEYASNLEGIDKQVLDDPVYTAVRCYGAEGVTAYVQNEEAKLLWGLPDGRGGTMHTWGRFEDSSIESASELMEAGKSWLEKRMTPQVSYTSRIPFAELEGVQLGDTVQVRDNDFTPTLRIFARVGAMERDLSAGTTSSVTFGNVVSVLPDVLARQYDSIRVVSTALNGITPESMMAGMNALYTSGGSYVCMTASGGIITANVPLNSDGSPTTTDGALSAVQMSAGSIRTATEVDDNGQWVWNDVQLSGNGGTQ